MCVGGGGVARASGKVRIIAGLGLHQALQLQMLQPAVLRGLLLVHAGGTWLLLWSQPLNDYGKPGAP